MNRRTLAIGAILIVLAAGAAYGAGRMMRPPPAPSQPIAFNHHKHTVKLNERSPTLACTACHAGADTSAVASIPSIDKCLGCHMKEQNDRPEEQAVRTLAARGGPLAFEQVTRNAGHVYFSHRAHVVLGELTCAQCHGDVTAWEKPPDRVDTRLTNMDGCIDCHRQRGASTNCRTCHK
jgi:c(7)-type cytochrome triheme protein